MESNATQSVAANTIGSNPTNRIVPHEAFRRALGSIKRRVNLMDPHADFRLARTERGEWLVQVKGGADVPEGGLSILVTDKGAVEIRLSQTNADAEAWLTSGKASKPDPTVKVRPEVALKQGVEALAKWWKVTPDAFFSPEGRVTLRLTDEEEWLMGVYKYPATGNPEWRIEIKENGDVRAYPVGLGL